MSFARGSTVFGDAGFLRHCRVASPHTIRTTRHSRSDIHGPCCTPCSDTDHRLYNAVSEVHPVPKLIEWKGYGVFGQKLMTRSWSAIRSERSSAPANSAFIPEKSDSVTSRAPAQGIQT